MRFDHDLQSSYAEVFLSLRELILAFDELTEHKITNQTSYKDADGMAIVLMKVREEGVRLVFGRGAQLQKKYPFLQGKGKTVRYLVLDTVEAIDAVPLREMIQESLILAVEHRHMRRLRGRLGS